MRQTIIAVGIIFLILLVCGCLGAQTVPASTPTPNITPTIESTPKPYPPVKPYEDRNVIFEVKRVDSNTISVKNLGGADVSSLMEIWVSTQNGYVKPISSGVTPQVGSIGYYPVSVTDGFLIKITGEFPSCDSILWTGSLTSSPTPVPTQVQTYYPISNPTPAPTQAPISSSDYYTVDYQWDYKSSSYSWQLYIPKTLYNFYKGQPHNRQSDFSMYAMSDYDRPYLQNLVNSLKEATTRDGYGEYDTVMMVIAFVQSLPYTSDSVTTGYDEYPRYPIETLTDNGGDCEDTAILTAALLNELGYGVVLIGFTGHMAVGVKGSSSLPGTYYEYNGDRYYYVETTGTGYDIGQVPSEYKGTSAKIFTMHAIPEISLDFTTTLESYNNYQVSYRVHCNVNNIGTGTAKNVSIYFAALALEDGADLVWMPTQTVSCGDYPEGSTGGWAEATLVIPRGKTSQIECVAYGDNFQPVIVKSNQFTT